MSQTCDKCQGQGIIGSGDNPHMREGRTITCDQCAGTGKIEDGTEAAAPEETPAAGASSVEEEKPVDNQTEAPRKRSGIFSWLG